MSRKTKIWLITATLLVLIGSIIFAGVMTMLKWDFKKLSTEKYETNKTSINENINNILIKTDTSDVVFLPSESNETSVICYEAKNANHSVNVNNGTLTIEINDTRKWYEFIGFNLNTPKITVNIPEGEYGELNINLSTGDVNIPRSFKFKNMDISGSTGTVTNYASAKNDIKIKTSTGNICVEKISANTLDLSVSTGEITASEIVCNSDVKFKVSTGKSNLNNIKCKNLATSGNTGDITLKNAIATDKFNIKRTTGEIKFENSDALEIFVQTDTGNVTGNLLTDKVFLTHTDTGRVNVPKTVTGGKCEITTDTGDIILSVAKK